MYFLRFSFYHFLIFSHTADKRQIDWSNEKLVKKAIQLKIAKNNLFSSYELVNILWWQPHPQLPLPASLACSTPGLSGAVMVDGLKKRDRASRFILTVKQEKTSCKK
jgi:hypothetical protein